MKLETLKDLFIEQLQDLYSAENQLVDALPKVAKKATDPDLKTAIETHLKETEGHVTRLERILEDLGEEPGGETCKAMKGLITEASELMKKNAEEEVMDAGLIADAQRVEHYEIAAYGTVCAYAKELGNTRALALLRQTLEEEKKADEKLTEIALSTVNTKAEQLV